MALKIKNGMKTQDDFNIKIKNFQVKETGYWSGDTFKVKGNTVYVPFHNGLYKINVQVEYNIEEEHFTANFNFFITLPDYIKQNERRAIINEKLYNLEETTSLEDANKWIKNLKIEINNFWINNCKKY